MVSLFDKPWDRDEAYLDGVREKVAAFREMARVLASEYGGLPPSQQTGDDLAALRAEAELVFGRFNPGHCAHCFERFQHPSQMLDVCPTCRSWGHGDDLLGCWVCRENLICHGFSEECIGPSYREAAREIEGV